MALCFEVRINDGDPVVAGLNDMSVLSAVVTFVAARSECECRVGGLARTDGDSESVEWLEQTLQAGDLVSIRIIESDRMSPPIRRERLDREFEVQEERKYYERLKAKYEGT